MNPISALEQTAIKNEITPIVCDKVCVVQRRTLTPDGMGGPGGAYSTISTTIAGMKQPNAGLLAAYASKLGSLATWHVFLPNGTDVATQDHLLIEAKTLVVQVVLTPQSYSFFANVLAGEIL